MFVRHFRKTVLVLAGSTVVLASKEHVGDDSENSWFVKVKSYFKNDESGKEIFTETDKKKLTGWQRLQLMYTRDDCGELSRELSALFYATYTSVFVGAVIGTLKHTRAAHNEFLERNEATQFANVADARRQLQDKVLKAGMQGAFKYAKRLSVFTACILGMSFSMMVYFDKQSIFYYGISTGVFGTVYKWKHGIRGMYIGGVMGCILGLIAGGLTKGLFMITGSSLDELFTYQSEALSNQSRYAKESLQKQITSNEYTPLLEEHDKVVSELKTATEDVNHEEQNNIAENKES